MKTVIVDNFFDDPEKILELSTKLPYNRVLHGYRSSCLKTIDQKLFIDVVSMIVKAFHGEKTVVEFPLERVGIQFHRSDKLYKRGSAHLDGRIDALVYLNKCETGGTSVFDADEEYVDTTRTDRLKALENQDAEEYIRLVDEHMSNFTRTVKVESKFNRAVIFGEGVCHGAEEFATETGEPRLVMLISLNDYRIVDE